MTFLQIVVLALIQALTEFLPVSSSAHLVLASRFAHWPYQGLGFDLAVHFGTLLAVLGYFRAEVAELTRATLSIRPGQSLDPGQRVALGIAIATIPAGLVGLALGDAGALMLRDPRLIATNLIVFGLLLALAERFAERRQRAASPAEASAAATVTAGVDRSIAQRAPSNLPALSISRALIVGCAQALALMPGVSRSGISMTAALAVGLDRVAAARYAFLLSMPIMVLATLHGLHGTLSEPGPVAWDALALGTAVSAVAGVGVIHFFLAVIRAVGVIPFVIYRVALGAFTFWMISHHGI